MSPWRAKWIKILLDPVYMGVLTLINVVFTIGLLCLDWRVEFKVNHFPSIAGVCIFVNTLYLLDLIFNIVVLGLSNMWKEKKIILSEALS